MFCCCFTQVKNNFKEYKFAFKELLKYIDYIEVSKFFMDVEKIKTILKSNNISEKWVSEKKLIAINSVMNNVKNMDLKKITINSTVLANSNFFF
jgi:Mg2+ and Co2+ transporter CorA